MVKINGYWYGYDEIIEALEKKGYTIIRQENEPERNGSTVIDWFAVKGDEQPTILNDMKSVALKEFHKKPPLV